MLYSSAMDRRTFLKGAGLGTILAMSSQTAEAGMFFAKRLFKVQPRTTLPITPNDKFYVVNIDAPGFATRSLDVNRWDLKVGGLVSRPLTLRYADLLRRPWVEMPWTLECVENLVDGRAISNAVWRGFRLRDLLLEAGADLEAAIKVIFRCADGYSDSIPIQKAMHPDCLLAYRMNGERLPRAHGFPLRALVPGLYGYKNPKWILELEVTNFNYQGYWQQRGWSDVGEYKIMSRIDTPGHYQEIKEGSHTLRGIAFSGAKGIQKVEARTDDNKVWQAVQLDQPMGPYTWVFWSYPWRPTKTGAHTLIVRATDGTGRLQSTRIVRPYPDGPEGLHTIIVDVLKT